MSDKKLPKKTLLHKNGLFIMKLLRLGEKSASEKVIMLGFFDSMHIGHRALLELANKEQYEKTLFTFTDSKPLKSTGNVFTFKERLSIFEQSGIKNVVFTDFSEEFAKTAPMEFLKTLKNTLNIKAVVAGFDFRFGNNAKGDIELLKKFCAESGTVCMVAEPVYFKGEKASSTLVKKCLESGKIITANAILGQDFFIDGVITYGRTVGRKLGFPTANMEIPSNKAPLASGVYSGYSVLAGKKYTAVINYGGKPTYCISEKSIEIHYIGFNGDLYGQNVRVCFKEYIRGAVKFSSESELREQIKKDCAAALKNNG